MRRTVYAACAVTLAIGTFFVFVWAPHPWGWEGFDHYHQLALTVAAGQRFPTMEVPWGYAYFLAAFYRVFGDHPGIPLAVQVALNALVPLLGFAAARRWFDDRIAAVAAALTAVCSFNTVYASTQSSDAICTVLFMAAVVAFVRARRDDHRAARWFAAVGALTGLAPQFRPNLILLPLVFATFSVAERRTRRRVLQAALLVGCSAAMLAPWVARNYRLTRSLLPTSVHGGVQLWYGTLQIGPYLNSRAYNPRSVFEGPVFEYTSLTGVSILLSADVNRCLPAVPRSTALVSWTDRDFTRRRFEAPSAAGRFETELPAPGGPAVLYYYFEWTCEEEGSVRMHRTPAYGEQAPFVFFVTHEHLGDLDVHGDLLDAFDLVRLARHAAWNEPLPYADRLAAAGVTDLANAVEALTPIPPTGPAPTAPPRLVVENARAAIVLADGSSITVPRQWNGRVTDVGFDGPLALRLMHSTASLAELRLARASGRREPLAPRGDSDDVRINRAFYREEPHTMSRYAALAFDNIRRDPVSFLIASLYRGVRMFVIEGTRDVHTAQQFEQSRIVYAAAGAASTIYLVLFAAGVVIAWRRGCRLWLPLLLILYVPATLAPVLTNMRYTVTVQPLVFMFIAVAITALTDRRGRTRAAAGSARSGTRTARRL